MKKLFVIHILTLLLTFGCKKKSETPIAVDETPIITAPVDTISLKCETIPPAPQPFGWTYSTADENKNVKAFFYNPASSNQIYYIVVGDIFGYNKLYLFDLISQTRTYLSEIGDFLPQISSNGWILFNKNDLNIYKIKSNGDSLIQLTSDSFCSDPKWNYTSKSIYYFRVATANQSSQLVELNLKGQQLNGLATELPNSVPSRLSNKVIYLKTVSNKVNVYFKDLTVNSETFVTTSAFTSQTKQNDFFNLTLDRRDENIFWSNAKGIFKCNLSTLKTDTLFKNCETLLYDNPIVSTIKDEMTYSCKVTKVLNSTNLSYEYKTYEMNLTTKEIRQIRIFP